MTATLTERLATRLSALERQRVDMETRHTAELAAIDAQIAALVSAQAVITPQLDGVYAGLVTLGLVREL